MWKPYLNAVARHLPQALQILDRFHIVKKLNEAIDEIRREESRARADAGLDPLLKKMRWAFLKKRCNWTKGQRRRMRDLEGFPDLINVHIPEAARLIMVPIRSHFRDKNKGRKKVGRAKETTLDI